MFEDYPQSLHHIPDNRPRPFPKRDITIMAGETTIHNFEIPFNVPEDTVDFDILYKHGIKVLLTKNKKECDVDYDARRHRTFINCKLSRDETKLFKETIYQCQVQIKFRMKDLSVCYSEIYPIKLVDSLDVTPFSEGEDGPIPYILYGLGYTED